MNKKQTSKTRTVGMYSASLLNKKWTSVLLMGCLFGLTACGNKGDLYLPKEAETQETTEQKEAEEEQTEKSLE